MWVVARRERPLLENQREDKYTGSHWINSCGIYYWEEKGILGRFRDGNVYRWRETGVCGVTGDDVSRETLSEREGIRSSGTKGGPDRSQPSIVLEYNTTVQFAWHQCERRDEKGLRSILVAADVTLTSLLTSCLSFREYRGRWDWIMVRVYWISWVQWVDYWFLDREQIIVKANKYILDRAF